MPVLPLIGRLAAELRARTPSAEIEAALAALVVRVEGDAAEIVRGGPGAPLFGAHGAFARVRPSRATPSSTWFSTSTSFGVFPPS